MTDEPPAAKANEILNEGGSDSNEDPEEVNQQPPQAPNQNTGSPPEPSAIPEEKRNQEPGEDEDGKEEEEQPEQTGTTNLSFKDMWSNSTIFKIIIVAAGAVILGIFIGICVALNSLRYESSRVTTYSDQADYYTKQYTECNSSLVQLKKTNSELSADNTKKQGQIDTLNTDLAKTKQDLVYANGNLTQKTKELSEAKSAMLIWQIGTGVGGGLTLGIGTYAVIAGTSLSTCNTNYASCQQYLVEKNFELVRNQARLEALVDPAIRSRLGLTSAYHLKECYNKTEIFDQDVIITRCGGYSAYKIKITILTATARFGVVLSGLPTTKATYLVDPAAFTYTVTNGSLFSVSKSDRAFIFSTNKLFTIGESEIDLSASGSSANVVLNPGTSYHAYGGSDIYGVSGTQKVTRLVIEYFTQDP